MILILLMQSQNIYLLCYYIYYDIVMFLLLLLFHNIQFNGGILHFATFMCNINYKFIYYANPPFSYYSQFTVIIFFDHCVTGYITILCMTIT